MNNENNLNLTEIIREIHDGVAKEMYCKGIDDFAKRLKAECREHYVDCDPCFGIIADSILYEEDIDEISEQLKCSASCVSDDVCKWELKNVCYTTSIKHYYSLPTPIVKTFNNCPYCGKKIKVVE